MSRGKHEASAPSRTLKQRCIIAAEIIGFIGSVITIIVFLQSAFSSPDSKGQSANVQATGDSQAGVIQTENGNVSIQLINPHETSMNSEDVLDLSCRQRLAKSYDLVYIARETGQYDEAISIVKEMVKAKDTDLQTMSILQYNLGLLLYDSGEAGAAQEAFRESVKGGGFANAFYCLGIACVKVEEKKTAPDYQEAIDAFTHAIEETERPEYYGARAWAYEKSNLLAQAEQDRNTEKKLLSA